MNSPRTAYRLTLRFADRTETVTTPFKGSRVELVAMVNHRMSTTPSLVSVGVVKTGDRPERFSFERGAFA